MNITAVLISALLPVSIALLVATLILYFVAFDRILRFEYQYHKDVWISTGKPVGFFWTPRDASQTNAFFRRADLLAKQWAVEKPEWIWEDAEATGLYNSFRSWRLAYQVMTGVCSTMLAAFVVLHMAGLD